MAQLRFEEIEHGAIAYRGESEIARLTGRLGDDVFGRHAWMTVQLAEGEQPDVLADLYRDAAPAWVADGYRAHYVEVRADDAAQVELWFGLAFGRQQVFAARPVTGAEPYEGPVQVRIGGPPDIEIAMSMADLIYRRHRESPVWSSAAFQADRAEWEEWLAEAETTYFVGELDARPVAHLALYDDPARPADEIYLAIAATLPDARGSGAMRALTAAAFAWAHEHGYRTCVTDWRSTNVESSRFWTHRGFRPTRYRLHRLVGH
jgi:GNAT superfamily N-acetyltransferase